MYDDEDRLVTRESMVRILREVMPRANPTLRAAWETLCRQIEARAPLTEGIGGPMGDVVRNALRRIEREPGQEG